MQWRLTEPWTRQFQRAGGIGTMVEQGCLKLQQAAMIQLSEAPGMLLDALAAYVPPVNPMVLKLAES